MAFVGDFHLCLVIHLMNLLFCITSIFVGNGCLYLCYILYEFKYLLIAVNHTRCQKCINLFLVID